MTDQNNNKKILQLREDYKISFGSEEAKRVLNDLDLRFHSFVSTFSKDSAYETAFLEGQRSVLLFIKAMIKKNKE